MSKLEKITLGNLLKSLDCNICNNISKTLSNVERDKMKKGELYPYYGATSIIDFINEYYFDGCYLLMAKDGTITTDNYKPIVRLIKGKFGVNSHVYVIQCENKWKIQFLYYALLNTNIKTYITGTVQPGLPQKNLLKIPLLIPKNEFEQQAIVSILSCIDDKIELLYKENDTLEKIINNLYNLYFTKHKKIHYKIIPLQKIAEIITGKTAPIEEYNKKEGKTVKIASVRDFNNSQIYITDTKEHITQDAIDKMHYTIAPSNTVLFVYQIYPGKVSITAAPMVTKTAIAQLRIKENAHITTEYLYLYMKNFNYNPFIVSNSIANSINKSKIGDIPIVIPDKETMDKFTEQVVPLFTKVKTNNYTIQTLERLRDALLPALMSGKIRVV